MGFEPQGVESRLQQTYVTAPGSASMPLHARAAPEEPSPLQQAERLQRLVAELLTANQELRFRLAAFEQLQS